MRILHLSDIHVGQGFGGAPLGEYVGRRALGCVNILLRRGRFFREAEDKVARLASFARDQGVDAVICSGDYTALGTVKELRKAREVIEPMLGFPVGFATVPGNHDVYEQDALRDRRFDVVFSDLLPTVLPAYQGASGYPRVQWFGDDIAVVSVNSATPSQRVWESNGAIPEEDLEALGAVLALPELSRRFVIVMTHYATRLADGGPDSHRHGMVNAEALLAVCAPIQRGMMVHGHIHHGFVLRIPELKIPICCAGSATHAGRESFMLYDIEPGAACASEQLRIFQGGYEAGDYFVRKEISA